MTPLSTAVSRPSAGSAAQEAADEMNASGKTRTHEQMVIDCLKKYPKGLTAPEVGGYTGIGHVEAQRRLSGLSGRKISKSGKVIREVIVFKRPNRLCTVIGKKITVWSL